MAFTVGLWVLGEVVSATQKGGHPFLRRHVWYNHQKFDFDATHLKHYDRATLYIWGLGCWDLQGRCATPSTSLSLVSPPQSMQQYPEGLAAERQMTFKLVYTNDTSFLHQVLDDYTTSTDNLVFLGRLDVPGERYFVDTVITVRRANSRLVLALGFSHSRVLPHVQKKAPKRTYLLAHMFMSALIHRVLPGPFIQPRRERDESGDTEVLLSPPALNTLGSGSSKENSSLNVDIENLGYGHDDSSPPIPSRTGRMVSSVSDILHFVPHVQTPHSTPTEEPTALQPYIPTPCTKRFSTIIRGKDLPFPVVPISVQRRHSLPALPTAEGRPKFVKGVIFQKTLYSPPQMYTLFPTRLPIKAGPSFETPRGTQKSRFTPPFSSPNCLDSENSERTNLNTTLTQLGKNAGVLRVPPFPLPHRGPRPRGLPLAPYPPAKRPFRCIWEPCNNGKAPLAKDRVGLAGFPKKRPQRLHLVDDNTLVQGIERALF